MATTTKCCKAACAAVRPELPSLRPTHHCPAAALHETSGAAAKPLLVSFRPQSLRRPRNSPGRRTPMTTTLDFQLQEIPEVTPRTRTMRWASLTCWTPWTHLQQRPSGQMPLKALLWGHHRGLHLGHRLARPRRHQARLLGRRLKMLAQSSRRHLPRWRR